MRKIILLHLLTSLSFITSFGQSTLNDSLKAFYPFNANALDESGNNNNGTVFGATLDTDRFGNDLSSYNFNGTNAYIDLGNDFDYQEKTILMWFYARSSNSGSSKVLYDCDHPNLQNGFAKLRVIDNFGDKLRFSAGNGTTTYDQSINLNQWYMLAQSINANTVKYYLNGQLIHTTIYSGPFANPSGNSNVALGCSRIRDRYFDGLIDDVRIYNRVLSETEIDAIYNLPLSIDASNGRSKGYVLFPNPTQNTINLNINDFTFNHKGRLKIYDSNGKIVIDQNIDKTVNIISVSDIENSIYYYELILNDEVSQGKFIKN